MTVQFCYLIFITADFYAVSNFIVPAFLVRKKYGLFIGSIIGLSVLSAWLRSLVALQMNVRFFHAPKQPDFSTLLLGSLLNISFWVLLITFGKMLVDKMQNQRRLEILESEKRKSELDFLKAQINPHALFNSLNTIYGHIDKSNRDARSNLLQFSELLRYQLYDCSSEYVSLENEIAYIRNFAVFHRLRKEECLAVDIDAEGLDEQLKVAPLLLIVPIENAFKFVGNNDGDCRIVIKMSTKEAVLHCSVFNTADTQPVTKTNNSNGIGIANFTRRLDLIYPGKYSFDIEQGVDFYKTNLKIELS